MPTNRNFGLVFFVVFLLIGLFPLISNGNIRIWSIIVSIIFLILGIKNSDILTPLNKIWFKFGLFIGKIVSPIVMGFIYFCVVTPIAIILKIIGKDVINLKKDNKKKTYWIDKTGPKSNMKKQF